MSCRQTPPLLRGADTMPLSLPTVRSLALATSLSLLALGLSAPVYAQAQPAYPPEGQRTVEFYVQHPDMRYRVNRACLNDPGHYRNNPDCFNADQANLEAAARQSHREIGNTSDPRTPAYWDKRPREREFKLGFCSRMTPEHRAQSATCAPAEQSLVNEQQASNSNRYR